MHLNIKTARLAGLFYLLQIPLGLFGILYEPTMLVVPNQVAATVSNILANEFLFRLSIVSAIACAIITVLTALLISNLLRPLQQYWANGIVLFAALAAPISMINELNHVAVLLLAKSSSPAAGPATYQVETLIAGLLTVHQYGLKITGIFFGLWLLPMGLLMIKLKAIPKIIGMLLLVTCAGYLVDFIVFFIYPGSTLVVSEYTWLGEVLMLLWLFVARNKQTTP
ncbi:MAG: DUF4386 domain-containing protein [Bacteroidetes bacterium]|nr:DUF4386 domain-containing protein [Bacteroidota bacterium]